MDAKLKADWVKALRSGEYEQARGKLKDQGGFCCLGVLAHISGLVPIGADGYSKHPQGYQPLYDACGGDDKARDLWRMNDDFVPFPQIADHIEQNL